MSIRLKCPACRTAFITSDDQLGRTVLCPKCATPQVAPTSVAVEPGPDEPARAPGTVFVPRIEDRKPYRWRRIALSVLGLLLVAAVAAVVCWPMIREWMHPTPPDPIAVTATQYLKALSRDDTVAASLLSTVEDPPAIQSYRRVEHLRERDLKRKGSFATIAKLNARINEKYVYDPSIGRFTPRNALGPGADTLDALHEAKEKAEKDGVYDKMKSGDPNDLFDAAEGLAKTMIKLGDGALAPRKLLPTYTQLVEDAKPPLPPAEKELALEFGAKRETWDALLKRPVATLKDDGLYILEKAEVRAETVDKLASSGDKPTVLVLEMVRFRHAGIDTKWKVVSAGRESEIKPAADESPGKPSR